MTADVARSMLPIPDDSFAGEVPLDAKDPAATFQPIAPLTPPAGAPNVLIVLLDDVGFARRARSAGPAGRRPRNASPPAASSTTASTRPRCARRRGRRCCRGRNHHTVGMGVITELATSAPGYTSIRPNTCAPLAETLRLNGYSTAQFGKCHEVPVWQTSPMGPFDAWPTGGGGFEYFYGFIGGETNQYYPAIYEGTTALEPERRPRRATTSRRT
jgi:arylsulfatase